MKTQAHSCKRTLTQAHMDASTHGRKRTWMQAHIEFISSEQEAGEAPNKNR